MNTTRKSHVHVAEVTSNLTFGSDPAFLEIDIATPESAATGLKSNSVVSCVHLATLDPILIDRVIGKISGSLKTKLDECLKAAMELNGYFGRLPAARKSSSAQVASSGSSGGTGGTV